VIRRLGVEGFVFPRILESGKKKNKNLVTFESKGSIGILSYVYDLSHLRSLEIILKLGVDFFIITLSGLTLKCPWNLEIC